MSFKGGFPTEQDQASSGNATSIQDTPISETVPAEGQVLGAIGGIWTPLSIAVPPSTSNANLVYAGPSTGAPATPAFRAIVSADLPAGIPATNIAGGTVNNTEFGYLDGVTSALQTQLNGKQATLSFPLSETQGGTGQDNTSIGTGLVVRTAANNYTTRPLSAGTGTTVTNGSGAAGNPSVNVTYGATASTATQGNDTRLPPTPTVAGKIPYDTGSAYAAITNGTSSQVLTGGPSPAFGNVPLAAVPTGIPATSIGTGSVDNTEFGYLDGVTSSIQTQLNGKQSTLTLPLSEANGGLGSDTSALTAGVVVKTATNTYATRTLAAPAAGFTITNPSGTAGNPTFVLANDLAGVEGLAGTGLAVRTATDTWTNRSLVAGTGTTVTQGDGVAGNPSVNVTYGTTASTATQGNDTRLPPTPTAAGKLLYDTGSAYAEGAAGVSGQILISGGAGAYTWGTRGGTVISFYLNTGQSFVANGYVGIAGDGSSTINVNVTPWRVPAPGTISTMTVFGFSNAPSTLHCLIYKATTASTSPTYSATSLDATVSSGSNIGEDTSHSVSVNKGDLLVGFCNTSWAANGAVISVMYSPT